MKIALLSRLRGGVGVYARGLATALLAADPGLALEIVTPDDAGELASAPRVRVHRTGALARRLPTHPGWYLEAAAYRRAARALPADVDLLHFVDARTALLVGGMIQRVGTMNDYFYTDVSRRAVRRLYRDWLPRLPLYAATRWGERRALRRLDHTIAISRAVAERVGTAYGMSASRFAVVPYGFDFPPPAPADVRTDGAAPTLVFVGGNFQRKGLHVLLAALPAVASRVPDVRLVVVGDSIGAGAARRAARDLGVASRVEFRGRVDYAALWRLYAEAAAIVMPSLAEAFGIPYLEGMHLGVPVVATACPGPDEILRDGDNAAVVPPGDVPALADAIVRVLGDTALRERLRRGGQATAAAHSATRMANETLAVYREVLARPSL